MAARGDKYMMTLRPAQSNPNASIRISSCKANWVTKMAAAKNPTSNMPTSMAVFACKFIIRARFREQNDTKRLTTLIAY